MTVTTSDNAARSLSSLSGVCVGLYPLLRVDAVDGWEGAANAEAGLCQGVGLCGEWPNVMLGKG